MKHIDIQLRLKSIGQTVVLLEKGKGTYLTKEEYDERRLGAEACFASIKVVKTNGSPGQCGDAEDYDDRLRKMGFKPNTQTYGNDDFFPPMGHMNF